jgi:hypothetical protein
MVALDLEPAAALDIKDGFGGGTQLGKRYGGEDVALELLCTKAGEGALSIGDLLLPVKGSKPLPSSD